MNPLHALQIVNDLALALVGEGEPDALTAAFMQRLLYHTGFAVAVLAERRGAGGGFVIAEAIGNRDLGRRVGGPAPWLDGLATGPSALIEDLALPEGAFLGCERYRQGVRLHGSDELALVLMGPSAPAYGSHLPALFESLLPRFVRAYAITHERAQRAREAAEELAHRTRIEASLRASEEQSRALFELSPQAVIVVDLEAQRTLIVNARARALLGLGRDELPESAALVRRIVPDADGAEQLRLTIRARLLEALPSGGRLEPMTITLRAPDGERRVELHAQAVGTRAVIALVDLTERMKAEEALRASKEVAERANQAKSVFLSRMSHEMRTPLNAILGFAQLLETDTALAEGHRGQAREILESGYHLLALVDDVIDLSRIEAGRITFSLGPVPVEQVARESLTLVEVQAATRSVSLAVAPGEPLVVVADPTRLRQVLVNLLTNGVKYNVIGGSVEVGTARVPGAGARARVWVRDSGPGIPEKRLRELFQPFSRLGADARGIDGSGIGLVVAKQLVELMGGSIGVESQEGVGTTFWLELPLAAQQDARPVAGLRTTPRTVRRDRAGAPAARPRVLIVEDLPMNQRLLGLQLEQVGSFDVLLAQHGAQALERWQAGDIDLILTDCNMPFFDGYQLAVAVREHEALLGSHVPILAVTASAMKEDSERCLRAGMDACLPKPLSAVTLGEAIDRWAPSDPARRATMPRVPPDPQRDRRAPYMLALTNLVGPGLEAHGGELLGSALASIEELVGQGRLHFETGHAVDVGKAMHKLRSSAALIGATVLATLARLLEQAGSDDDLATMRELWPLLESSWQRVRNDLASSLSPTTIAPQAVAVAPAQAARDDAGAPLVPFTIPVRGARGREVVRLRGLRALVIDDDPLMLHYVGDLLNGFGLARVLGAHDGQSGLDRIAESGSEIDLVLCDLAMPGMDGVELLRHLADREFKGSVVLMSGAEARVLDSVDELARQHGFNVLGTLRKPFGTEALAALLAQHRPSMARRTRETRVLNVTAEEVEEAIRTPGITIFLQPKVRQDTLEAVGVEALARWFRPDGAPVPPMTFVRVAEANGLADELFKSVFAQSLAAMRRLDRAGHKLKVSVNVSATSLARLEIAEYILTQTAAADVDPKRLVLEVTETGLVRDLRIALDVLNRLRLHGLELSIDDFGTGYSSIDLLRRVPFTELKVDRSFVMKSVRDASARHIIASSVVMARGLGLRVVAEGVETEDELALMGELGCDEIQGYLIGRPMAEGDLHGWLDLRRASPPIRRTGR